MDRDVVVIGAGPAGTVAAAMLAERGYSVEVLERAHFPRFSVGESLLPQSMVFLEEAGLLDVVQREGFQLKNGAIFRRGPEEQVFDLSEKTAEGWAITYQVARDRFDLVLAQGAAEKGAVLSFGALVTDFTPGDKQVRLTVRSDSGAERRLTARFALDASGFGRVLARLLDLDRPSDLLRRRSVFTHVEDHIPPDAYDRNKVLISVHPRDPAIWYWLIPLKGGISSIGVVGLEATIEAAGGDDEARLQLFVSSSGRMGELLANAERIRPVDSITGYSCSVKSLIGQGYAMLGNAAEFLDPIFSSGVTIALKSATLASSALSSASRRPGRRLAAGLCCALVHRYRDVSRLCRGLVRRVSSADHFPPAQRGEPHQEIDHFRSRRVCMGRRQPLRPKPPSIFGFGSGPVWRIVLSGLLVFVFASGCATPEVMRTSAVPIGRDLSFKLPAPPGYPKEITLLQTVRATYGNQRVAFQTVASLAADKVHVVITLPTGPRLMTIDWSALGVATDRSNLAPPDLMGENILADMVIALWDLKAVRAALPDDATAVQVGTVRTISRDGREVVTVVYSGDVLRTGRMVITNHDFGYELVIASQRIDGG